MDITMDTRTHEVRRGERVIYPWDTRICSIRVFLRHPHQVLSRL